MWTILEYLAWAGAAALLVSMIVDALRVEREYDEDTLLSSKEGIDELIEHGEAPEVFEGGRA